VLFSFFLFVVFVVGFVWFVCVFGFVSGFVLLWFVLFCLCVGVLFLVVFGFVIFVLSFVA